MRVSTGISGLDDILHGGFLPGRVYLIHGEPGTGKTTLGLHFVSSEEGGVLISFTQSADHLRADAASFGLNLDNVRIVDLTPAPDLFVQMQTYDIFSPVEVEREPISHHIAKAILDANPRRIYVDSFGQFRNLASDAFHYHRLAQSFFRFATQRGATLVIGSHDQSCARDVDGVIRLNYCGEDRTVRVTKFRGSDFLAGDHAILFTTGGLQIPVSAA
jgi:circadian clock protein KaiC